MSLDDLGGDWRSCSLEILVFVGLVRPVGTPAMPRVRRLEMWWLRIGPFSRQLGRALGTSSTLLALFLFLVLLDHVVNLFDHSHFLCYDLL